MPVNPKRVQAVFLAVVEHKDPTVRAAFLDRECGANAELRQRVESLLRANDEPGSFLDQPFVSPASRSGAEAIRANGDAHAGPDTALTVQGARIPSEPAPDAIGNTAAPVPIAEGPGNRIGSYELLEKIGEGGMDVVYLAEQEKPVRRRVAIKIIKPGMDSEHVIA